MVGWTQLVTGFDVELIPSQGLDDDARLGTQRRFLPEVTFRLWVLS